MSTCVNPQVLQVLSFKLMSLSLFRVWKKPWSITQYTYCAWWFPSECSNQVSLGGPSVASPSLIDNVSHGHSGFNEHAGCAQCYFHFWRFHLHTDKCYISLSGTGPKDECLTFIFTALSPIQSSDVFSGLQWKAKNMHDIWVGNSQHRTEKYALVYQRERTPQLKGPVCRI